MTVENYIQEHAKDFVGYREHIHAHPELSFEEYKTSEYICQVLEEHDISYRKVAETGIIADIVGSRKSDRVLALRADLDALPIHELNEVPYKSTNDGVMHACGHDVHSAILLSTATVLQEFREELEGTVRCIFQPGEEKHPGGASLLIKEGVLDGVQAIVALHVYPHLPSGTLGFRKGKYMASTDEVYVTFKGRGGHAAMPHLAADPIALASEFVVGVQQVISRKKNPIEPSVLTFGTFNGGIAPNVIPDEVKLSGTLRCLDEDWRHAAHEHIQRYAEGLAQAWGCSAEVHIPLGYPSLYNHPMLTTRVEELMIQEMGESQIKTLDLRMTAEDFSFYTHHVPGCFYRLGTSKEGKEYTTPVHNAHFDVDPTSISVGVRAMTEIAMQLDTAGLEG